MRQKACDGSVDIYHLSRPGDYQSLGSIASSPQARTGRLVPELHRYFVAAPQHEGHNAQILIYEVH
ncbi:MAG: hypothetical protein ABI383_09150 [Acidobacteriaceae bacterium]